MKKIYIVLAINSLIGAMTTIFGAEKQNANLQIMRIETIEGGKKNVSYKCIPRKVNDPDVDPFFIAKATKQQLLALCNKVEEKSLKRQTLPTLRVFLGDKQLEEAEIKEPNIAILFNDKKVVLSGETLKDFFQTHKTVNFQNHDEKTVGIFQTAEEEESLLLPGSDCVVSDLNLTSSSSSEEDDCFKSDESSSESSPSESKTLNSPNLEIFFDRNTQPITGTSLGILGFSYNSDNTLKLRLGTIEWQDLTKEKESLWQDLTKEEENLLYEHINNTELNTTTLTIGGQKILFDRNSLVITRLAGSLRAVQTPQPSIRKKLFAFFAGIMVSVPLVYTISKMNFGNADLAPLMEKRVEQFMNYVLNIPERMKAFSFSRN